ncbi:MAG: GntR family transcriptional regulator [Clostridiales Family XIII bacterium]|jgi:DNA-binding GntR family transcriptional regulator|nr:GntR family transcriptional regulator [Clostridiales Family XIII bacterium]
MDKTERLSTSLLDTLRRDILREKIQSGGKLTEREICETYNVSRTPVREALRDLKNEGLIELLPNKGAYVCGFTVSDMRDLFALRGILEAQCVRWAIERITSDELEALEQKYEFLDLYTRRGDTAKLRNLDAEFHGIIYEASQSRLLTETLRLFRKYIKDSAHVKAGRSADIQDVFAEHAAIFEAFIAQDSEEGAHAMREHIRNAAKRSKL